MNDRLDAAIRASLADARSVEPTEREVRAVLSARPRRRARRWLSLSGLLLALIGGLAAVPATRAGIGDALDQLAPWVRGEGDAPGRPALAPGDVPPWMRELPGDKRVLAEVAGVRMTVARGPGETLHFALGDSYGTSGPLESFEELLAQRTVSLIGPASLPDGRPHDDEGRRPLFGITTNRVVRVELTYRFGEPSVAEDVRGGFGLLVDLRRPVEELVAYDRQGAVLGRKDFRGVELRICFVDRGCPPGELQPPRITRAEYERRR